MDTNKPPYRLLYSVVLFQVMTPISTTTQLSPCLQDRGIYRLCTYPGTLRFSITPHRTSCFYKDTPNHSANHTDQGAGRTLTHWRVYVETTFVVSTRLDCQTANQHI